MSYKFTYKPTPDRFGGKVVYEAWFMGIYHGLRIKAPAAQLRQFGHGKDKLWREVVVGTYYAPIAEEAVKASNTIID